MKRAIAILLIIGLSISGGIALADNTIELSSSGNVVNRLTKFSTITPSLSVSDTTASYRLSATGTSDVTSISATLQIQVLTKGDYVNYGSPWSASSSSRFLNTSGTKTVASGGTYRLKVTVTAYYPGGSSTETAYS